MFEILYLKRYSIYSIKMRYSIYVICGTTSIYESFLFVTYKAARVSPFILRLHSSYSRFE